jgi:hypothetical protein
MALHHNPRIITDGLVLYLDAANIKSFRGEPTVNELGSQCEDIAGSGWTKEGGFGTYTNNYCKAPDGTKTATRLLYSSGYFYRHNTGNSPTITGLTAGETITFSCWVKALNSFNQSGRGIGIWSYAKSGIQAISSQSISQDSWTRVSVTYTIHSSPTPTAFCFMLAGAPGNIFQGDIAVWHPQLEFKDHVTHFTASTRGTTVATGGGLIDLSGNENHGELVNGPTYDSDNLGSLEFYENYINIGNPNILAFTPSDSFTIIVWFNVIDIDPYPGEDHGTGITLFGRGSTGGSHGIGAQRNGTTGVLTLYMGTRAINSLGHSTSISSGEIYCGTLTYSPIIQKAYKNAVQYASSTSVSTKGTFDNTDWCIFNNRAVPGGNGAWGSGNFFLGQMYNRVLSQTEITQNYNAHKGRFGH